MIVPSPAWLQAPGWPIIRSMSRTTKPFRPTPQQLCEARDKTVPDVIAPGLRVLFCGINPGLYSGATGHHFAKPGNRFWPALHRSRFTPRQISPFEERELLDYGLGVTNVVMRTTASAAELSEDELVAGAQVLQRKVKRYKPRVLAVLGIGAYRSGFGRRDAQLGLQPDHTIGSTRIWVLPNPSGLNAHYTLAKLSRLFAELREAVEQM